MDSEFNFQLFTSPDNYEEDLLRERKSQIEYWTPQGKAKFIRNFIALANTARMLGRPAYLLLGIRNTVDGSDQDICGIGEMYERQAQRGLHGSNAFEVIRRELSDLVHRYVEPRPIFDVRFAQRDEKVFGYIAIQPLTRGPFCSREYKKDGQTYLRQGQCWIRFGESNGEISLQELDPEDDRLCYSYAEVPYVLPSVWERYFAALQRQILLLWRSTANPPPEAAYQELCDLEGRSLTDVLEKFLDQRDRRLLVLRGRAGCGKSLWLQRLAYFRAQVGQQQMQEYQRLGVFEPPRDVIPLLLQLRDLSRKARSESTQFVRRLCDRLSVLWENGITERVPRQPEMLFHNSSLHWLILLDGLDELGEHRFSREFLRVLVEFLESFPKVRVVLTTRPVLPLEGIEWAEVVDIAPLSEAQVESYFAAHRTDKNESEIKAFIQQSRQWTDAWELLTTPVYLSAAVASLGISTDVVDVSDEEVDKKEAVMGSENPILPEVSGFHESEAEQENLSIHSLEEDALEVEKPFMEETPQRLEVREEEIVMSLPRFLDRVYSQFWRREQARNLFPHISEVRCGTYMLAATTMSSCPSVVPRQTAKRYLKSQGLQWTLEMGILGDNEYDQLFFTLPSCQIYSATKQLQGDIEGEFFSRIRHYVRRWQHDYRSKIELFYEDLTGQSLSNILTP